MEEEKTEMVLVGIDEKTAEPYVEERNPAPEIKITSVYAAESDEKLVPIEKTRILNEHGQFVDQKQGAKPDLSLFWKGKEKLLALVLLVSSLLVFLIMLAAGEKYTSMIFYWFMGLFSFLPKLPF